MTEVPTKPIVSSSPSTWFQGSLLRIGLLTTILTALVVYMQIRGDQDVLDAFSVSHRIQLSGISQAQIKSITDSVSFRGSLIENFGEPGSTSDNTEFNPNLESEVLRIAREALLELETEIAENKTCIPTFCKEPYHFFSHHDHIKNYTFLDTFPGSGNTWLRSVIQEGTRVYTGSIYNDGRIARAGFLGERRPVITKNAITSAIKSHNNAHMLFASYGSVVTGIIQIVRAPFDAVLAEFNRRNTGGDHVEVADERATGNFFDATTTSWKNFHYSFNSLKRVHPVEKRTLRTLNSTMRLEFRQYGNHKPVPILTMFYEDFVRDPRTAVAHLYAFLKTQYGEFVPSVKEAILCAAFNAQKEEVFHRHTSEKVKTPLYSWSKNETKPMGIALCNKLQALWNEHKWGTCDGKLQKEKPELNRRRPFLPGVQFYPECSPNSKS